MPLTHYHTVRYGSMKMLRRARPGFTLIEILVVIAVIAILAALVAPNVVGHVDRARVTAARAQVEMLSAAIEAFRMDTGRYPTTAEGLSALTIAPPALPPASWRGPYLQKDVPLDPWQSPYEYASPGTKPGRGYDVSSWGADASPGGEGINADIGNW